MGASKIWSMALGHQRDDREQLLRKRLVFTLAIGLMTVLAAVYLTSPLLAAYKLRQAVRSGDTETIRRMVEWDTLRASIRATVSRNAKLLPIAHQVGRTVKPTFWQRIRSVFGHSMLDRFIESYITPEGLPKLYRAKTRWHERFKRQPPAPTVIQAGIAPDRLVRTWRRVRKAEFRSLFHFVLEIEDRHVATRLIRSSFRLTNISLNGFDWRLTEISIRQLKAGKAQLSRLNAF